MNARAGLVSAAEIAAGRGWSRWKAQRFLRRLEAEHGASVVVRQGGRRELFGVAAALARIGADTEMAERIFRLESQVSRLAESLTERDRRIDGLSRDFVAFRRAVNEWFFPARTSAPGRGPPKKVDAPLPQPNPRARAR